MVRAQLAGRELLLRGAGFQAAFLSAAAVAARMGAAQVAAHQIGLQLWTFTALLLDSFAIAAQSLVGAALGGGDVATARRTAWRVVEYGLGAGIVFGVLLAAGWWVIPAAVHLLAGGAAPGARAVAVVRRRCCRSPAWSSPWTGC